MPATATVDVPAPGRRRAVETAAWFVVSEALANATKHSGAGRATVWLTQRDGNLRVEVVDDGRGGADAAGAGLEGLAPARRGAGRHARGRQPARRADARASDAAVRVT